MKQAMFLIAKTAPFGLMAWQGYTPHPVKLKLIFLFNVIR